MNNLSPGVIALLGLLAFSNLPGSHSIRVEAVEEGPCSDQNYQAADFINQTWISTAPVFYLVGGSAYDMFRKVQHAFGNNASQLEYLSENQVSNDACFQVKFSETGANIQSFNGASVDYASKSVSDGVTEFTTTEYPSELLKATITLTDNKSFVVFATCWPEQDQKAWAVISTTRILNPEIRQQVEDHVIRLGFSRKKFFFFESANCPQTILVQYLEYRYGSFLPLGYAKK